MNIQEQTELHCELHAEYFNALYKLRKAKGALMNAQHELNEINTPGWSFSIKASAQELMRKACELDCFVELVDAYHRVYR